MGEPWLGKRLRLEEKYDESSVLVDDKGSTAFWQGITHGKSFYPFLSLVSLWFGGLYGSCSLG